MLKPIFLFAFLVGTYCIPLDERANTAIPPLPQQQPAIIQQEQAQVPQLEEQVPSEPPLQPSTPQENLPPQPATSETLLTSTPQAAQDDVAVRIQPNEPVVTAPVPVPIPGAGDVPVLRGAPVPGGVPIPGGAPIPVGAPVAGGAPPPADLAGSPDVNPAERSGVSDLDTDSTFGLGWGWGGYYRPSYRWGGYYGYPSWGWRRSGWGGRGYYGGYGGWGGGWGKGWGWGGRRYYW